MKRTPLKRSRKRIRPRSAKREAIVRDRAALVVKVLVGRPRCEFRVPLNVGEDYRCSRGSTQVHEPLTRARGGSILDESNTFALCSLHHWYLHSHPIESQKLGLLRNSWDALGPKQSALRTLAENALPTGDTASPTTTSGDFKLHRDAR